MGEDPIAKILEHEIRMFVRDAPGNKLPSGAGPFFDEPLVGFAAAADPLFSEYKRIIGSFHATPAELFEAEFGAGSFSGGTVVSWILPIARATRRRNGRQRSFPGEAWAHTRWFGEKFNEELRRHVMAFVGGLGFRTLAPVLTQGWRRLDDRPDGPTSTWSERHAAYAAGLGTFSLNDGLITEKGIAHRCGSVVTELVLPATPRPYDGVREWCLFCSQGSCGVCIRRCPAGAISESGHDKLRCFTYMRETVIPRLKGVYGVEITGCGLCQTKVPCEEKIPRTRVSGQKGSSRAAPGRRVRSDTGKTG